MYPEVPRTLCAPVPHSGRCKQRSGWHFRDVDLAERAARESDGSGRVPKLCDCDSACPAHRNRQNFIGQQILFRPTFLFRPTIFVPGNNFCSDRQFLFRPTIFVPTDKFCSDRQILFRPTIFVGRYKFWCLCKNAKIRAFRCVRACVYAHVRAHVRAYMRAVFATYLNPQLNPQLEPISLILFESPFTNTQAQHAHAHMHARLDA